MASKEWLDNITFQFLPARIDASSKAIRIGWWTTNDAREYDS